MKSRGVYETPGGTILLTARRAMESITLDRGEAHIKVRQGRCTCRIVDLLVFQRQGAAALPAMPTPVLSAWLKL